jgi:hypothetical protein
MKVRRFILAPKNAKSIVASQIASGKRNMPASGHFDRLCGFRLPLDACFPPKATYLLRGN